MTDLTPEQHTAITYELATAPKIQDDLKAKFGHGENKFFYLDLVAYRMHNSCEDIAEDLDVKSRYGINKNETAIRSVGSAFRGYDGEHFPEHEFGGLLGKITNDYIAGIRQSEGGLKGYANSLANLTPKERIESSRKANEAQGFHVWSLEKIVDIHNFREESIGKGRYKTQPSWDYVIAEMNEKHGEDFTTDQVKCAYYSNK